MKSVIYGLRGVERDAEMVHEFWSSPKPSPPQCHHKRRAGMRTGLRPSASAYDYTELWLLLEMQRRLDLADSWSAGLSLISISSMAKVNAPTACCLIASLRYRSTQSNNEWVFELSWLCIPHVAGQTPFHRQCEAILTNP